MIRVHLLYVYSFVFLLLPAAWAQTVSPTAGGDGVYEVAIADLKKLDSSPKVEFPPELAAYELADSVAIALTITPDGRVKNAKAVSGKNERIKEAATTMTKRWAFQPYLVNGNPVPVRTEITLKFDNTLDHYADPSGEIPVPLDEIASHALIVKQVPPQYPEEARAGRIQGSVELRAIVGVDGHVHALHIVTGHPLLAPAAYNAVRQWEFKPYVVNGKTLPVDTNVTVNFKLG
jgi:TonB family protein